MMWKTAQTVLITIASAFLGILCSPGVSAVLIIFWLHSWSTTLRLRHYGLEKMQGMDALMANYPDMIVMASFLLSGTPKIEEIGSKMQNVLQDCDGNGNLRFKKLSQIMEKHYGLWFWSRALKVHLKYHIHLYKGIAPSSEAELKITTADVHSVPLRCDKPRWQITLIPLKGSFLTYGIQSCVVFRFHHSIADAYTFLKFVSSQLGDEPIEYKPKNMLGNAERKSNFQKLFMFVYALSSAFRVWFQSRITERNLLHGPKLSNKDYITWATFDLNVIKALKNASDTTVTDMLLSCLSGAIRKHFTAKNAPVPKSISCIVPMGRYKPSKDYKLCNSILVLRLCLPMDMEDPVKRLQATKAAFDELKQSPDVAVQELAVRFLMSYLPKILLDWFVINTNAITIGTSSLAGPDDVQIFGCDVKMPLVFQPHNGLLGINIFFYGCKDKLFVGLNADSAIVKCQDDLDMIISYLSQELGELYKKVFPGQVPTLQIPLSEIQYKCPSLPIYPKMQIHSSNSNIYKNIIAV